MRLYKKIPVIETPWLLCGAGFALPFAIVIKKGRITPKRLRHEYEHVCQWWRYWILGFVVLYLWDLGFGYLNHRNLYKAYRDVRFERWAREVEHYG